VPNEETSPGGPPPRLSPRDERAALFLLRSLAPRVPRRVLPDPPTALAPFDRFAIPRRGRPGSLDATWYPAAPVVLTDRPRGAVLLVHPWFEWGQAYFHRRGRIEALRAAGYGVLTFDLGGFGGSAPPAGLWDRDVEDALAALAGRAPGLPLHLWGVSSGGYWSHMALARGTAVQGALFEDVSPHLIEWSGHTNPLLRPCNTLFRSLLPRPHAYLDLRRHAPFLAVRAAAYAGGERDRGIPAADTRRLAELAGAELRLVPGAGHLAAIKEDGEGIVALGLRTFARAEGGAV
jgi:pimeloyl-ACP methyl ester carboxylesterase